MSTPPSGATRDPFEYDDRRRLSGDPIEAVPRCATAVERIREQYPHFEWRTLAVRGERLHLGWSRWSDDAGNETTYLLVHEVGDDGRIAYDGRFDEDDFEGAYRELERRYYAGEGAAFAEGGAVATRSDDRHQPGRLRPVASASWPPRNSASSNRSRSVFR